MDDKKELSDEILSAPLVHGGLWKAIWLMSWPLLLSTVATSFVGAVDVQVSGYLGPEAQAAVGLAEHVIFIFMIFIFSVSVGTTAIVSREFGEGNSENTVKATAQSLSISVSSGFVLALAALLLARYFLPFFTKSPAVVEQGCLYLSIFGLYMIPFSLVCIIGAAFRAVGDARTPLLIVLFDVIVNIVGDYLTVLCNWPVPGLGIRGIAASGVVASVVAALVSLFLLHRSPLKEAIPKITSFDWSWQKRILKIGLPSAVQRLGWAGSVFAVFFILARVPNHTAALAAWTIGMRVEALLFMPLMALSLAVSSIVGQNLGAAKPERAMKAGWNVSFIGIIMMLLLGSLMYFSSDALANLMSLDPFTRNFAGSYMRINALVEPFLALAMVLMGAMQGAGDTKVPMWISLFSNWVIRLPVAWWLSLNIGMGTDGVWWAMVCSVVVCAWLCVIRYRSRKWLTVRV
ncbi:MAG: MATE family efflux transporter [Candidatus Obscuribacterales bacterium]|nr:MATE family efflux transporter [Candidatus Obscuribacterales bacterium]